jgi:hypothetical protein
VGIKTLLIGGPEFWLGVYGGLWAVVACAITLIIVSVITPHTDRERKAERRISEALASPVITMMDVSKDYSAK